MRFRELATFDVFRGTGPHPESRPWPWIAFAPSATRLAFPASEDRIATRVLDGEGVVAGASFGAPAALAWRGLAVADGAERVVLFAADELVSLTPAGVAKRSTTRDLGVLGLELRSVAFDRTSRRLWLSLDGPAESALALLEADTHAVVSVLRSKPIEAPALHELYTHPHDDAVLLLVACGEAGTFARVAGWSDGPAESIATELDGGSLSAGFVGFSRDGAHVHLAEADELRTHAWPGLHELSSVQLADDFVSSYAGVVLGDRIFVDGEDADAGEDGVMQFDRSAIRGTLLQPPFPTGMWAGRFGADCIVTVEATGRPAKARVLRIPAPSS